MNDDIVNWMKKRVLQEDFNCFLSSNLLELCKINTIPENNLGNVIDGENNIYNQIEKIIKKTGLQGTLKKYPILEGIKDHPVYTDPGYTDVERPYRNRNNLVFLWEPGKKTGMSEFDTAGIAVNAHVDTVPPFIEPYKKGDYIYGRGACDDKGGCITIIGALKLLKEIQDNFSIVPLSRIICMFVTDEEIGGNGSLSLALENDFKDLYDTIIVYEPSDSQIHPGNRGALWYSIDLDYTDHSGALKLALCIILYLEKEGNLIKAESIHPLFDKDMAQTCHGIFGTYGNHPATICDEIKFSFKTTLDSNQVREKLTDGLSGYTEKYGDKTLEIDESTGGKKVDHHFDINKSGDRYVLHVWGRSGHMGSVVQNDNAITKASYMLSELIKTDPDLDLDLVNGAGTEILTLEGGQGFLPTHTIEEIESRFEHAVNQAWQDTASFVSIGARPRITFSKLHNEAFAGTADSAGVRDLADASKLMETGLREPMRGFPVSCDARIFAKIFPGLEVITTGPGSIKDAHSNAENVRISEVALSSAVLALFILKNSRAINYDGVPAN